MTVLLTELLAIWSLYFCSCCVLRRVDCDTVPSAVLCGGCWWCDWLLFLGFSLRFSQCFRHQLRLLCETLCCNKTMSGITFVLTWSNPGFFVPNPNSVVFVHKVSKIVMFPPCLLLFAWWDVKQASLVIPMASRSDALSASNSDATGW